MSAYQLVNGMDVFFPSSLGLLVMKIIQEVQDEPNDVQRRINQTIQLHQSRDEVQNKTQFIQENVKKTFDTRTKDDDFNIWDQDLRWDSRREDKGKQGKFDNVWNGPYIVHAFRGNNAFYLKDRDGSNIPRGPVNGRMLKHYISQATYFPFIIVNIIVFMVLIG